MRIKKYQEFKDQLIKEQDEEDEFGLGLEDEEGAEGEEDEFAEEGGDEFAEEEEEEEKPYNDTPEVYINNALNKLKTNIESLFDDQEEVVDFKNPETAIGPDVVDRSEREKKPNENMTLKDMGAKLESSDVIKSSSTHKSIAIKFSDEESYYSLYVKVSLAEVIKLIDDGEELTDESVQSAYVKMKKISLENYEELGTVNRNVMLADIDEKFIIELKLELDGESAVGEEEEEDFAIET